MPITERRAGALKRTAIHHRAIWLRAGAEHRRDQIVEEEQELRAKTCAVSAGAIERDDDFGCSLPRHGDIGHAGIHGGGRELSAWAVEPELHERNELVQRLVLGRTTVEAAGEIERAVLDRKAPMQGLDRGRK